MGIKRGLHLTVLIEKDEDHYSARCLEFNLAADGNSVEEVIDTMKDLVVDYISYAIENDKVDSMFDPSPKKYYRRVICHY
ncbi:MAG: type II toxin-antitoxin system HicB family antitoxin [Methanosarcinales archaeon]